jgi:hypothetical protein
MNLQQKIAVANEGLASKIWDDIEARERVGVDDPIGMRERITSMMLHEAELQGKVQVASQPQGQSPAGPGGPPGQATGGQPQGGPGAQAASPQMTFRPLHLAEGQGPTGGAPQGVTRDKVAEALQKVADKLRGVVWALGELAAMGQTLHATLGLSNFKDTQTVLAAVRPMDPGVKTRVVSEEKLPPEAVRLA